MKFRKEYTLVAVLLVFLVQLAATVDAVAPPGTTYTVYGYVKESGTNLPISGATVSVYGEYSTFLGSTTTSTTGYFTFSRTFTVGPDYVVLKVSKSGYVDSQKTVYILDETTNAGTIYMTVYTPPPPPPPAPPTISQPSYGFPDPFSLKISLSVTWHCDPYVSREVYYQIYGSSVWYPMSYIGGKYQHVFNDLMPGTQLYIRFMAVEVYGDLSMNPDAQVTTTTNHYVTPSTPWIYSISHLIKGVPGIGTGYQVRFVVHYGYGVNYGEHVYLEEHCRPDFADVRFTLAGGTHVFNHYISEVSYGDYAVFWVKIDVSLDSDVTVGIFYGHMSASSTSNGDATFLFFDDFSGSSLNTNKWKHVRGTISVSDGCLRLSGNTDGLYVSSKWKDGGMPYVLTVRMLIASEVPLVWWREQDYTSDLFSKGYLLYMGPESSSIGVWEGYPHFQQYQSKDIALTRNVWFEISVQVHGNTYYVPILGLYASDSTFTQGGIALGQYGLNYPAECYVDMVTVRRAVDVEPAHGRWDFVADHFMTPNLHPSWTVQPVNSPGFDYVLRDSRLEMAEERSGADDDYRGYNFIQHVSLEREFEVEAEISFSSWASFSPPCVDLGLALYSATGAPVASISYTSYLASQVPHVWAYSTNGQIGLEKAVRLEFPTDSIHRIFGISRDASGMVHAYCKDVTSYGYISPPTIIASGFNLREVAEIRLYTYVKLISDPYHYSEWRVIYWNIEVASRGIKIANPVDPIAPFQNPVRNGNFDTSSCAQYWDGPGQWTNEKCVGTGAWMVAASQGLKQWCLSQTVRESECFKYDAIRGKSVCIDCLVAYRDTPSQVRVELTYRRSGSQNVYRLTGSWVYIAPSTAGWHSVSVCSPVPLPMDLSSLSVLIVGKPAIDGPFDYFSAYIDECTLSICERTVIGAPSMTLGFEPGADRQGSAVAVTKVVSAMTSDMVRLGIMSFIYVQSRPGWIIQQVSVDFLVSVGDADLVPYDGHTYFVEANDRGYAVGAFDIQYYSNLVSLLAFGVGVVVDLAAFYFGCPYPLLGTAASFCVMGLGQLVLSHYRNSLNPHSSPGMWGNVDCSYPREEGVTAAALALHLGWNFGRWYGGPAELTLLYHVVWSHPGYPSETETNDYYTTVRVATGT